MRNIFKRILVTVIAAVVAVGVFLVAACDDPAGSGAKLSELEIENARTSFLIGDEFEYGDGFIVWAVYEDGSKVNVTAEASITKEATLDMNAPGNYQITVHYGGLIADYKIYVSDFDNILRKIEIDTSNLKTVYNLGDEISFDGIKLNCTFENAQGALVEEVITSVKDFTVEVKNSSGAAIDGALPALGNYTVTISSGAVKANYTVKVANVDISTVESAMATAAAFSEEVLSGVEKVESSQHSLTSVYNEYYYTYEFGDNYLYTKEYRNDPIEELHLSLNKDGSLFCVDLQDGEMTAHSFTNKDMMQGARFLLWYANVAAYGVDAAIAELYERGAAATNGDFKVTANSKTMEYSFSYSGLEFGANVNAKDYYETEVTFKLGPKYNIESAEIKQGYWENNDVHQGLEGYHPNFTTNETTGKTTTDVLASKYITITVEQVTGTRVKTNPYNDDEIKITSFDLTYDGKTLENGATITTEMSANKRSVNVDIENILPSTADFTNDPMYFRLTAGGTPGVGEVDSSTMLLDNGLVAFRTKNRITISFERGGEWTLAIRVGNIEKTINLSVTGFSPTEMNASIYNAMSGQFYRSTTATTMAGGKLNFYGEVNEYANSAQTAVVTSANKDSATVVEEVVGATNCFAFSASEAGVYTVKITSSADDTVGCEITINVVAAPDLEAMLSGKYRMTDAEDSLFEVTFTPANSGGKINGTVEIKKTPINDTTEQLDPSKAKTQVLSYEVKEGTYEIEMTGVSGDEIGALIKIDTSTCDLVIEDQYGMCYKLDKVGN